MPVIGFHSIIDRPESVKRVQPPTRIRLIRETSNVQSQIINQDVSLTDRLSVETLCELFERSPISSNNFLFLLINLIFIFHSNYKLEQNHKKENDSIKTNPSLQETLIYHEKSSRLLCLIRAHKSIFLTSFSFVSFCLRDKKILAYPIRILISLPKPEFRRN